MAKKPKSLAPLNMSDDMKNMLLLDCGVMLIDKDDPMFGVMTVETPIGHYDFVINPNGANQLIQKLREFIAGDSPGLLDDDLDNPL
jgi:hypothetical protein